MRVSDNEKGYVFAFAGDEQASPHFMRYSGLTGACINAVSFNNFIDKAIHDVPFADRFRAYSKETNWSNGEVVQRGTGGNFGEDGFLRPGFSYKDCVSYLHAKVTEFIECEQDTRDVLSRDWKEKLAASLIPRGMEMNNGFTSALLELWNDSVFAKILQGIEKDTFFHSEQVSDSMYSRKLAMTPFSNPDDSYWKRFLAGLKGSREVKQVLERHHFNVANHVTGLCREIVDFAVESRLKNGRVTSELFKQPKPVDSIVDDFAVEAQTFATALTFAAAFGSAILAFQLVDRPIADTFSAVLGSLSILIAFGTMTSKCI